jgi:hypothetical protein
MFSRCFWQFLGPFAPSEKATHPHIVQINVLKHVIPRISNHQMMIDGGRVRIRTRHRAPLDMLESPVITLGCSKDCPQGIAKRIKGNDVGVGNSGHCEYL